MFVQCTALENITKRSRRRRQRRGTRERVSDRSKGIDFCNVRPKTRLPPPFRLRACHCGYFKFGICEWEMRPHEKPQQQQLELILARIANDSLLPLSHCTALAGAARKERKRLYRLKFACFNCLSVRPSARREDD